MCSESFCPLPRERALNHPFPVSKMKTISTLLLVLAVLPVTATTAEGQLNLYAGPSHSEVLGGSWGADVSLGYNLIALPLGFLAGADYFLTDCREGCSLWGWRLGVDLRFPIPGATPYVSGSWVHREGELGMGSFEKEGISMGAGLSLDLGVRIRAEVNREFVCCGKTRLWEA